MKIKKGVHINQMKRELAQLLETGQERTARIRVEHVIREEKMVATYDLIEIYCEFIVGRLPIIESQKTSPVDLKEAVTSVICAAPRCSDISELYDVRKQFTAKYVKDFVSAAIELHPDCGVSCMKYCFYRVFALSCLQLVLFVGGSHEGLG
ncbi:putative vacuolar protein sorting-associated protein Ist1 [Helianthus annuus]|nr:putative vacuolar protein sorting-associated protein Ist1 [Helianthus annuus]